MADRPRAALGEGAARGRRIRSAGVPGLRAYPPATGCWSDAVTASAMSSGTPRSMIRR
jgi:hypothetical protein